MPATSNPPDRVRDGRHLMNGTRWIDAKPGEAPPEHCVGMRRVTLPSRPDLEPPAYPALGIRIEHP